MASLVVLLVSAAGGLIVLLIAVSWVVRSIRSRSHVNPILLEAALDADLRALVRAVRARPDIESGLRVALARTVIRVAAQRTEGASSARGSRQVQQAWNSLRQSEEERALDSIGAAD